MSGRVRDAAATGWWHGYSCDGAGSVEVHVPRAELKGRVLDGVPLRSPEGSEIRGVERGLINSWSVMENEV
jgi:hypothetical protein